MRIFPALGVYAAISVVMVSFGNVHALERGMSVNTAFSRELLKRVLEDVRAYRTSTGDRFAFKLTDAWVYKLGTDHWEFHFDMFYWHGSAGNGYEARAKGWRAWLAAQEGNRHEEDAVRIETDGHLGEGDGQPG